MKRLIIKICVTLCLCVLVATLTSGKELSSASLRNWNDGMLEKWNNGMAPFGQINAYGGDARHQWFCRQSAIFTNHSIKSDYFSIPTFHYSIIPIWNMQNGCLGIPYYQQFAEFQPNKIKLICSPLGGYSMLPESGYQIAYIKQDGSVNWQKLNRMLQEIANNGANMWREFPPWITSEKEYETLTPFKFAGENMVLNQQYFDDLRKIARLSKMYNLTLIYDLFNGSETRVNPTCYHSPWKKFPGYFYTAPQKYLEIWIDAVLEANSGIDTWYQLCNEPSFEYPAFMSHVYCYLIKKGIPPERIILGLDMRLKSIGGVYETGYRKFRQMVVEKLGQEFEIKIKRSSWTPFHATIDEALTKYWGPETPPGGQRREIYIRIRQGQTTSRLRARRNYRENPL